MEWICMIAWAPPWKMIEVNGVGLIFDLPLFKTSHIQSCTIAAHSILTSCCFTTSTSAKEKKYKRQWKVNYLSLCWTPNLFVISISAFSGLLMGSLFWKGVSAKLRNPHRRSKKEVWVTPCVSCLRLELNQDEWSNTRRNNATTFMPIAHQAS